MNRSGRSVAAVLNFYKIDPANMLVAYDEIDFEVGITRFKEGGGHGGHNGIRDIINALGGRNEFYRRLRRHPIIPGSIIQYGIVCSHI